MLRDGAIEAEGVWKRFRSDHRRGLKLHDHLLRWRANAGGRSARWRWALRDIDLRATRGESIGLIGANGSGKSTLLKILNRVMYPYAGTAVVGGRIGALVEVRGGLHQELSGRENIFVYGTLLGSSRRDVARRLDEIVAFAELESALDRQTKFYSTGMQMRLGFAVAAHLEPDVFLVDEILAIGDASFQQRCLDRMREVTLEGTTLILVSHDLASVEATCERGVWLDDGQKAADGPIGEVLYEYRKSVQDATRMIPTEEQGPIRLLKVAAHGPDGGSARSQQPLDLTLVLESEERRAVDLCVGVSEGTATPVFVVRNVVELDCGEQAVQCELSSLPLPRGRFAVLVGAFDLDERDLLPWRPVADLDVIGPDLDATPAGVARLAPVQVDAVWTDGDGLLS